MMQQQFDYRVYYEDTDAGGVMYHSHYLNMFERARSDFLRQVGYNHHSAVEQGFIFAVQEVQIKYLKPAVMDDALQVRLALESLSKAAMVAHQTLWRGATLLSEASVKVVCVNSNTFRPCRIPTFINDALMSLPKVNDQR